METSDKVCLTLLLAQLDEALVAARKQLEAGEIQHFCITGRETTKCLARLFQVGCRSIGCRNRSVELSWAAWFRFTLAQEQIIIASFNIQTSALRLQISVVATYR